MDLVKHDPIKIEFFGGWAWIKDNPDRKWWQFWKPKSVLEIEDLPEDKE